jgi:predicted ArsR family transcriptional regulator
MSTKRSLLSTRERILEYLKEYRTVSVVSLSQSLGLTRADIRYHLNALVDEGLVERAPRDTTQAAARGRPVQQYRLVTSSDPGNLAELCHALIRSFLDPLPQAERSLAMQKLALILSGENSPPANITQRLNQAISYLNQHHYRARWEAHRQGPRILLRNCPYAAVLPSHPELCQLDRELLQNLLKLPMRQAARIDMQTGSPPACIFVLSQE